MNSVVAGLKVVRGWIADADEKAHALAGKVDEVIHAQLVKIDALIAKLEGTFAASGELSDADAAAVEEAFGAFSG